MLVDRPGRMLGYHLFQRRQRGPLDVLDALEMPQQLIAPLLPHAGDLVQGGTPDASGLLEPLELNGKAVGLLLDAATRAKTAGIC